MFESLIRGYIISSDKTIDRLPSVVSTMKGLQVSYEIISSFDQAYLVQNHFINPLNKDIWIERTKHIAPVLLANTIRSQLQYDDKLAIAKNIDYTSVPFLSYRELTNGEISVNMKHYSALISIALSSSKYGLILEDDVLLNDSSFGLFSSALSDLEELDGDYLDLAGGAGLLPDVLEQSDRSNIVLMRPARTRTNAAYVVSKQLAISLSQIYFPFVFPIDWHLQYLMQITPLSCYWAIEKPLIHGSESGSFTSWRD